MKHAWREPCITFQARWTIMTSFKISVLGGAMAVALLTQTAVAAPPLTRACQAPPLPAPAGNVVTVATEPALQAAVAAVTSNTTIVVQPGTYDLAAGGGTLFFNKPVANVTLRGATDRCDDVVLIGAGMTIRGTTPHGIWVGGPTGMLIANLTVRDVYFHPVMLDANYGTQSPRLYNLHLINAGEQFVKATPVGSNGPGVANGIVEYSIMEYVTWLDPGAPGGATYTNGVDVHAGSSWIIRYNLFRNIRAAPGRGLAGPAILMWNGSRDTIVESNLFLNTQRGIALGLNGARADDHVRGIVRNNVFYRSSSESGDVGISINNSADTKVLNNTVILSGTYPSAIEYRFSGTTGALIQYNLADAGVEQRDGASATVAGNVTNAQANWFVNIGAGDLHLAATAVEAINKATPLPDVTQDYDGTSRPVGLASDIGAHEFAGTGVPPAAPSNLRVQ
jgi:hypothetical protein